MEPEVTFSNLRLQSEIAPQSPRLATLGGASQGLERQRPLTGGGGSAPPFCASGRPKAANLISDAQLTPRRAALRQEALRRRRSGRRAGLYQTRQVLDVAMRGIGLGFRQTGATRGEWSLAPHCLDPIPVEMNGAAAKGTVRLTRAPGSPFTLTLWTKCRRCADCLKRRRNLWAYRAQEEITHAPRTWFATFTLAPHRHVEMRMRASARLRDRGTDLEVLPGDDIGAEVSSEYRRELTLYFKRLRKQTGVKLRYILVQEQHKSGLPHFHALIHEVSADAPVRHSHLRTQWKLGHANFKLVDGIKCAWYVAKYLAKSVESRVRASIGYGRVGIDPLRDSKRNDKRDNSPTYDTKNEKDFVVWCPSQVPKLVQSVAASELSRATPKGNNNGLRWLCKDGDEATAYSAPKEARQNSEGPSAQAQPRSVGPGSEWRQDFDAIQSIAAAFGLRPAKTVPGRDSGTSYWYHPSGPQPDTPVR